MSRHRSADNRLDLLIAELPGWVRAAITLALWAIRAFVALFVAFWASVIVTVTGEAVRGLPSETENAELAAVGFVLLGATPVIWWWLGRRRLLATPSSDVLVSDDVRVRRQALVDLHWLTAKLVVFCLAAFVVSVAIAVLVAMVGESMSGVDPLESDRVMTFVLVSGTILTGLLWWTWRHTAASDADKVSDESRSPTGSSEEDRANIGDLDSPNQVSNVVTGDSDEPAGPLDTHHDIDVPKVHAGAWPGAVDLDENDAGALDGAGRSG